LCGVGWLTVLLIGSAQQLWCGRRADPFGVVAGDGGSLGYGGTGYGAAGVGVKLPSLRI
jgi:hypothetical protein